MQTWQYIIIVALGIFIVYLLKNMIAIFFGKAPYITTSKKVLKRIIDNIDTNPKTILELGSGQGLFLRLAHKKFPKAKLIGVEDDWWPILVARLKSKFANTKIEFVKTNLFNYNTKDADLIYLFLNVNSMAKLEKKLQANFRPGQLIVSFAFSFPNLKPNKVEKLGNYQEKVFFYKLK